MNAAKRIKELRLANNLTTTELAARCDMPQPTISKIENNKRVIDLPTLTTICKELNVTLAEFFYYDPMPIHLCELLYACKDLSPEQVRQITLTIKGLTGQIKPSFYTNG